MLHKRDLSGAVEVDGQTYEWALQREPQWCTADGWRGMTVSLQRIGASRAAILEFPMPKRVTGSPQRQRPQMNDAIAANGVRAALLAGWDPASRGKVDVFMVDANGR
ncbi:hypothetical protein [Sphingopyxis sp. 22461]|mgnify:CR=1 FL=1|jgi:hypothetical protein|uniref:hypothetical protein n=1 Tax=Sphingopyxis sp. 22461 TaxID=3453923 RepID=UPI003F84B5EB